MFISYCRNAFRDNKTAQVSPFRIIGSLSYSSIRPRSSATASLKCESLSRRDIPFAVSIETAIEYASLEHDVETSPEDWKL